MTSEPPSNAPLTASPNPLRTMLIVAIAAVAFAWFLRTSQPPLPQQPGIDVPSPNVGKPFPPLTVEGWINGPGPTEAEMAGKVRVIEAWAFWCGPCLEAAPHLRELYEKYHSRGVVFVGLTGEGEQNLSRSQKFVENGKITWPNGYGAEEVMSALQVEGIPQMWVVDKEGKIAWEGHPLALPEGLLDRLLQ